jgi:hypothetical protein
MDGLVGKGQAIELKTLGFNVRTMHFLDKDKHVGASGNRFGWDYNESFKNWHSLPYYQQAFQWFRSEYGIKVTIDSSTPDGEKGFKDWYFTISNGIRKRSADDTKGIYYAHDHRDGYDTYEEAEFACLQKVFELVKQM